MFATGIPEAYLAPEHLVLLGNGIDEFMDEVATELLVPRLHALRDLHAGPSLLHALGGE